MQLVAGPVQQLQAVADLEIEQLQQAHPNFHWNLALSDPLPEDHWNGYVGFIHQVVFENYLRDHPAPEDCEYYLCGPRALSIGVLQLLFDLGVDNRNIFFDNFAGEDRVTAS